MGLVGMAAVCRSDEYRGTVATTALQRGTGNGRAVPTARLPHPVAVGWPLVPAVDLAIAAGVAFLAGAINSIAGGGSLILFPTLVALGLPTVAANVTNSVAQWPGYLGGIAGFRGEYVGQRGRLIRFGLVALLGGTAGSVLLLTTPSEAFDVVVPVLVLLASLLLAVQPLLARRLGGEESAGVRRDPGWVYVALFLATVYGGYFGGALGVILVGVLGIALHRLKLANALKSALSAITATVTLVVFGFFGDVHWDVVAVAAPASLLGGFLGARIATRIPAGPLRVLIVTFGVAVSVYLFLRA
jgi:uncharacterized membrane protein YfcA